MGPGSGIRSVASLLASPFASQADTPPGRAVTKGLRQSCECDSLVFRYRDAMWSISLSGHLAVSDASCCAVGMEGEAGEPNREEGGGGRGYIGGVYSAPQSCLWDPMFFH